MARKPVKKSLGKETVVSSPLMDSIRIVTDGIADITSIADAPPIQFVSTVISSFNRASIIGGFPVGLITLIHGPYAEGKTLLAMSILKSFAERGHIGVYFDAENAGDTHNWFSAILGEYSGLVSYKRPGFLENMEADVDKMITNFKKGKKAGNIDENACLMFVVDTINKAVPKDNIKTIKKADDVNARGYPVNAMMISNWLDHLTPQLGADNIGLIMIAQERDDLNRDKQFWEQESPWRVKGGKSIMYDSSLIIRCRKGATIKSGEKDGKREIGKELKFEFRKNKVAHPGGTGSIFISNGEGGVPKGLDYVREYVKEARDRGIIIMEGKGHYRCDELGLQVYGENKLFDTLQDDPASTKRLKELLDNQIHSNMHARML